MSTIRSRLSVNEMFDRLGEGAVAALAAHCHDAVIADG
jgi:hypothetical protein